MRVALVLLTFLTVWPAAAAGLFETEHYKVRATTVAGGLDYPWSVAFLPGGRYLVTERPGRMRVVEPDGAVSAPLSGMPEVWARGQGGLLDVALSPDFAETGVIFFSYSEPGPDGDGGTALARAVLDAPAVALRDVRVLFRQTPKAPTGHHFGSRIVFGRDGTVFVTTGDRGQHERAQDPAINRAQVIRIDPDGSIPADNPFVGDPTHRPEVWSMGHRNPQGAALHPETGELWAVEHGAKGGDEINIVRAGRNYGWPVIGYGRHYSGETIGVGARKAGMEQPIHYWDPSIAPSGMAFYTAERFPAWKGNLFVGALKYRLIARLTLDGDTVVGEERMLMDLQERIRDVRQGPDGYLYILTDSPQGRLIRLSPDPSS
ncbi:MAG: PQQ-dependent sugar dehydrogenase [Alphaproteobacteria bacterium]|nr:PQQ-dependent sugar dehydrogenase [Alphaproteobacteria bacterium]